MTDNTYTLADIQKLAHVYIDAVTEASGEVEGSAQVANLSKHSVRAFMEYLWRIDAERR